MASNPTNKNTDEASTQSPRWTSDIDKMVSSTPDPKYPKSYWEAGDFFGDFRQAEPFWGYFLTRLVRVMDWGTEKQPMKTAYVSVLRDKRGICFGFNPDFLLHYMSINNPKYAKKTSTQDNVFSTMKLRSFVIMHELGHVIFKHLGARKIVGKWAQIGNIAMDLAINSIVADNGLPQDFLMPGKKWLSPEDEKHAKPESIALSNKIATLPRLQSSEFYFYELQKHVQEEGGDPESEIYNIGFDLHDGMSGVELSEDDLNGLERDVADMIRGAVDKARVSKQWGSVPSDVIPMLLEMAGHAEVNWRSHVNSFIRRCNAQTKESSLTRFNKKLPWMLPGTKRQLIARLLVVIDQSGSMPDEMVAKAFTEVCGAAKNFEVHTVNVDTDMDMNSFQVLDWKNNKVVPKRTKSGGTDLNCAIKWLNEEKKNFYTGVVFITDGYTPKRDPLYGAIRAMWIVTPGGSTEAANPEDIVVELND